MKKILPFLLVLSITACSGGSNAVLKSNVFRDSNPIIEAEALPALVEGNNAFALDLYRSLRSTEGNLILSPFSVSIALAMTYAGARGGTESQMAEVLKLPPQAQTHPTFNTLDLALQDIPINLDKEQEPMQLNIANALWAEQTFSFESEFLDTLAKNYGVGVRLADFINRPEPARKDINNWVSDKTEEKIKDLLPEGAVSSATRMVLVNAIYFKADWLSPFDANDTGDQEFTLLDGSTVIAPFMHQNMYIPYAQGEGWQAVRLAYAGESGEMLLVAPDAGTFEAFESIFDDQIYSSILADMQETSVSLSFPKFQYESAFILSDALKEMSMTDAFDPNLADFSGMTGNKDLFIGNVIHKAFVAVDEEGTEAAAATAVIMDLATAAMSDVTFTIDRPFIYIIRDIESGQILFIGRVLSPIK